MLTKNTGNLNRRLLPLYIAVSLQAVAFWYSIEKLFMTSIGYDAASIGMLAVIMSIIIILTETPSGILADRWSRKGVAIIGALALAASTFIGFISHDPGTFIFCWTTWGIFTAMYSGTYDSMIYDTLIEEKGNADGYNKHLGRLRIVEGTSFVIGALVGGFIADSLGLRETFLLSLPTALLSIPFLLKFKEPSIHRSKLSEPIIKHIKQTFSIIIRNRDLAGIVIAAVGFGLISTAIFEFYQLWFIGLGAPALAFGFVAAFIFGTWSLGGLIERFIRSNTRQLIFIFGAVTSLIGLVFSRNYLITAALIFILMSLIIAFSVFLASRVHDQLPSSIRAGSSSVISTLIRTLMIPMSLGLSLLAQAIDIFAAGWILVFVAIIAAVSYFTLKK